MIGATFSIAVVGVFIFSQSLLNNPLQLAAVFIAIVGLAVVGATDDIRPLEGLPRLLLQAAAIAVLCSTAGELRIFSALPW